MKGAVDPGPRGFVGADHLVPCIGEARRLAQLVEKIVLAIVFAPASGIVKVDIMLTSTLGERMKFPSNVLGTAHHKRSAHEPRSHTRLPITLPHIFQIAR